MDKPAAIAGKYLTHVRDIRASGGGTKETSYYPALSALLADIGKLLRPSVLCVIQLKNRGAGFPDGGLFPDLTAGWGHAGKGGVTMPGKGKVSRRDDGAFDIFLNDIACWRNVPEVVWDYTIGGYQVIKKWLSYREKPLLGRGLTPDEVRYVTEIARRLAALTDLQDALNANYRGVADSLPLANGRSGGSAMASGSESVQQP